MVAYLAVGPDLRKYAPNTNECRDKCNPGPLHLPTRSTNPLHPSPLVSLGFCTLNEILG